MLSAGVAEKPVPVMVKVSPRFGVAGDTAPTVGVCISGIARTENEASIRQSPMLAVPFKFVSPTASGKAGGFNPPTVRAHASASLMFTLRSPLMSPRSITLTGIALDVPAGDTAVTDTASAGVNWPVGTVAMSCVALTNVVLSGVPPSWTCVAGVKFWPVTVSLKLPPNRGARDCDNPGGVAVKSLMIGRSAPGGRMMYPGNSADVPALVVTVKLRVSVIARGSIPMLTGRFVDVAPLRIVTVTPVPLKVTAVAPVRFCPLIVVGMAVPAFPEDGVMPVIIGVAGDSTVKPVNGADVPAAVVTVKLCVSGVALVVMVMLTDRPVAVPAVPMIAVTPVPLKSTLVAPVRSVPVIKAGSVVPIVPDVGSIALTTGTDAPAASSAML